MITTSKSISPCGGGLRRRWPQWWGAGNPAPLHALPGIHLRCSPQRQSKLKAQTHHRPSVKLQNLPCFGKHQIFKKQFSRSHAWGSGGTFVTMAQLGLVFKVFVHQRHRQLFGDKVTLCGNGDGFAQTFGQAFQPFGGALVEQIAVDRSGQRHLFFQCRRAQRPESGQ